MSLVSRDYLHPDSDRLREDKKDLLAAVLSIVRRAREARDGDSAQNPIAALEQITAIGEAAYDRANESLSERAHRQMMEITASLRTPVATPPELGTAPAS